MNSKDVAQPFLNTYLFAISDYLAIIPYFIVKFRSKKINSKKNSLKIELGSVLIREEKRKKKLFFCQIFSVAGFDFLSHVSSLVFYLIYGKNARTVSENNLSSLLIFNIITIYLLSRLILKTYFYRHHYFAFLINIFCIIILATLDLVNIIKDQKGESNITIVFYIIKKAFSLIFYSVEDVIGKKALTQNFMNIYALILYRGIFESVFMILSSIPFIYVKVTDKSTTNNKGEVIEENDIIFNRIQNLFYTLNAFKIIMFIITNFFYNIFIWLIIDNFSPSHYAISQILESFGTLIRLWITEPDSVDLPVLRMFFFIILIFASLIYTEIIVIKLCKLEKNTKLFLDELEKNDIQQIMENSDEKLSLCDDYSVKENEENKNENNTSVEQIELL